ncbi:DUF971 domain-containing protein [Parendozoicomonas sp. Alg238-R29]|uniref:DUF971 domain-containing protein n=1 Tax=Parendozoicomonas sp. Alg238-R29 TaxID=2993446 RepID=UPI00248E8A4A|nr:DUF971 domain-containing protein [Parendozoicomonas sp. Alg238-R29]
MTDVLPISVRLHKHSQKLELCYRNTSLFSLSCEYLRVHSPSAEVQGHGEGQEILQTGKINIAITAVEPVGNYGLKLVFDDGHDSGIYTWEYLRALCDNQEVWWKNYLERLEKAGASRDPDVSPVRLLG